MQQTARHHKIYSQLRRGAWFGNLAPSIAEMLFDSGRLESYDAGDGIYPEDAPTQGLFGIVEGAVHFERGDHGGQRLLLHVACPGYWFGEIAATGAIRTMVSARAFVPTQIWRVPVHAVSNVLTTEPELFGSLSTLMAGRFAALIEIVCMMHKHSALAQVAGRLAILDRNCKESDSAVAVSVLRMTQSDLADMTGHVRQTFNTAIKQLENEGLIKVGHRQIEVLKPAALAACSIGG
ncbi:MAG: Crp/Fnr family transcriptional regulator [Hyphomicrobium sp.]